MRRAGQGVGGRGIDLEFNGCHKTLCPNKDPSWLNHVMGLPNDTLSLGKECKWPRSCPWQAGGDAGA